MSFSSQQLAETLESMISGGRGRVLPQVCTRLAPQLALASKLPKALAVQTQQTLA